MASNFLSYVFKRSSNLTLSTVKPTRDSVFCSIRTCHTETSSKLISRIITLGRSDVSLSPVLDLWVKEGKEVKQQELRDILRYLRSRQRFSQALEVSEWMSSKGMGVSASGDHAVRLDLIGRGRGLEAAESYFNSLEAEYHDEKTYGSLLNCCVRAGLVDKSLAVLQKMKDLGHPLASLNYNNLMVLYANNNQLEKLSSIFEEMKENGVSPNNFSYRHCIDAYGKKSDLVFMEKVLEEMESQPNITMDWMTYSIAANHCIKAGLKEKALIYLKKFEENVGNHALGFNHLISLHASLGNKDEITRLWNLQKVKFKKLNNPGYIVMLGSLVKLDKLEEAEELLKEWESSCQTYDFRVPNVVLIGYCKKGLVEKAEGVLRRIVNEGKTAIPNSWAIITAGYIDKENLQKAYETFKEAMALQNQFKGWRPKPRLISSALSWLSDHGDVDEVEDFVKSLEREVEMRPELYRALIKTYTRCGKGTDALLVRMKAVGLEDVALSMTG